MGWIIPAVLALGLLAGAQRSAETPIGMRCEPPATTSGAGAPWVDDHDPFTPTQRNLATQLVALFENRTTELQYGFTHRHDDGRGYTVGAVGFTTGTSDALEVIRTYTRLVARDGDATSEEWSARLAAYQPALERIDELPRDDSRRADVSDLDGFDRAWAGAAAADPLFRAAQDSVAEAMYYVPALRLAKGAGLRTGFARAAFLDAIIQHGGGEDPDGLPAMVVATTAAQGTPSNEAEEREWLRHFLDLRRAVLECPHAEATRDVWKVSVSRVDVYRQLLEAGNLELTPPLRFRLDNRDWVLEVD